MVQRLSRTLLLTLLLPSSLLAAAPVTPDNWHYRQAAWAFYLQQPAQALETLQLAKVQDPRTALLEAGLYLQLGMPQHAADILQRLLNQDDVGNNPLPRALRNVALLQFARYQLELGNKALAQQYLTQVQIGTDGQWLGEQQLLSQLVSWPDISLPEAPPVAALAGYSEMPYIVSNQALALARAGQSEVALNWLKQLEQQLNVPEQKSFWALLFSGQWRLLGAPTGFIYPTEEKAALGDYITLLKAQLHIDRQELADAEALLASFPLDSVLSDTALGLYSHILTEQRHIPTLLAVLQQQIKQQPFSLTAWQGATRLGEQLERQADFSGALAAYQWAEQYYQQQGNLVNQQARPLQVSQLQQGLSDWQQLQLTENNDLYRLSQDILTVEQQLAAAPQRQQRLQRLTQVVQFKLEQQQQLLSSRLPQLSGDAAILSQRFDNLRQQIADAEQQPLALSLTDGETYQQLRRLEQAEQRFASINSTLQSDNDYAGRLARLRGLLHWQYSDNSAQGRYQRRQQLEAIKAALHKAEQQLAQLAAQGSSTERLKAQQQRLVELSASQQQLNLALLSQQQQLLARLNQQLQQQRSVQLAQLTELQRHNKQAMARMMERLLPAALTQAEVSR
ncbi:MAG: hypothetical protein AB1780_09810 [Pseudomonadota bacterium]